MNTYGTVARKLIGRRNILRTGFMKVIEYNEVGELHVPSISQSYESSDNFWTKSKSGLKV
jgi:hypothetical protein